MPQDANARAWAAGAITMAEGGAGYSGNTSAYWFDADAFYELVHGAGERPVRALIEKFDGCSGAKAGEIAVEFLQRSCGSLTRNETTRVLRRAREMTTPVSAARLGAVGKLDVLPRHYARQDSVIELGVEPKAHVPFIVEAWAENAHGKGASSTIAVCINRTPVTGNTQVFFDSDKDFMIHGCGLHHAIDTPTKKGAWRLTLNVTAPYVPITTDGKEPDLEPAVDAIGAALAAAIKKAHRNAPRRDPVNQIDVVFENLKEGIARVSDNGKRRFAQRQLLYAMRPIVMAETGKELKTANFDKILTAYENEFGDIPGMFRDNRGGLYQPHTDDDSDIPVGTLMVEAYERPPWTFNKIVYIEKQGYFEVLKAERWPERHDCALLTSKGYSSRAVRDLIDRLVEHDEPVQVFCVHDADAAGTMIMQTLQEETAARGARQIEIINLGLEPWEAEEMGLEAEEFEESNKRRPVADYVLAREDGEHWGEWLQSNRYELNAMTTAQILDWLDAKMEEHGVGKVVPPQEVITEEARKQLEAKLRARITERVLREADLDAQLAKAMTEITVPKKLLTPKAVEAWLEDSKVDGWRDCVEEAVQRALADREV